jgi:hypothetical protein
MRAGCWYDTQMQIGKASGWFLLVAAFFLAAAETAAHAITGEYGIMGIARVMEILVPAFFVELAGAVRGGLHPALWDQALLTVMALPGWFLAGAPGLALAWRYRERPVLEDGDEEDLPYTTYDDIQAAADEEAELYGDGGPSKYKDMGDFDPTDLTQVDSDMDDLFVARVLQHGEENVPDTSQPFNLIVAHQITPPESPDTPKKED